MNQQFGEAVRPSVHVHDALPTQQSLIGRGWNVLTVGGNLVVGLAGLVTGNLSTLSVATDGAHCIWDVGTYQIEAETILNRTMSEQRRDMLRKVSYWAICGSSGAFALQAVSDAVRGQEHVQNGHSIYAAAASVALNGLMWAGFRRKRSDQLTVYEKDVLKHFWGLDMPSASIALGGALLQQSYPLWEQLLAAGSGLLGAWFFRPTRENLAKPHVCMSHDHHNHADHDHQHDHHAEAPPRKTLGQRLWYRPRHQWTRQKWVHYALTHSPGARAEREYLQQHARF